MVNDRKLTRSCDGCISGVCAGVADHFLIDPIIVRILMVAAAIATGGMAAIGYVVLWVLLPSPCGSSAPLDVRPDEVESDAYGRVSSDSIPIVQSETRRHGGGGAYRGAAGHMPPQPPKAYEGFTPVAGAPGAMEEQNRTTEPAQGSPCRSTSSCGTYSVKHILLFAFVLLTIGISALLDDLIDGVYWWETWPLLFVLVGICRMVLPERGLSVTCRIVRGLVFVSLGVTLLAMTLGVVDVRTMVGMGERFWPILIAVAAFFAVGSAIRSEYCIVAAGLCFIVFCIVGMWCCAIPGPIHTFIVEIPFLRSYVVDINPWL